MRRMLFVLSTLVGLAGASAIANAHPSGHGGFGGGHGGFAGHGPVVHGGFGHGHGFVGHGHGFAHHGFVGHDHFHGDHGHFRGDHGHFRGGVFVGAPYWGWGGYYGPYNYSYGDYDDGYYAPGT
jgi:hypothetical protein